MTTSTRTDEIGTTAAPDASAPSLLEWLVAAGIREDRARDHLRDGLVYVDEHPVTDPAFAIGSAGSASASSPVGDRPAKEHVMTTSTAARTVVDDSGRRIGSVNTAGAVIDHAGIRIGAVRPDGTAVDHAGIRIGHVA